MKMPPTEQIGIAVLWLQNNEGEGIEGEACRAVADWIEHMERERIVEKVARGARVTKAVARRKLAEIA